MTVKEALLFGEKQLTHLETPHLDAAVLLAFVLKKPKIFLYAHLETLLTTPKIKKYKHLLSHRAKYEPVAYLTGTKEFYGREFMVNNHVLIPRPETELLIDEAKKIPADIIIDVGTGSGILAVTLAKELKKPIMAIDKSAAALAVARRNAKHHLANIKFFHGHLLEPFIKQQAMDDKRQAILIVANLPYLPTSRQKLLGPEIKKYEPMLALFAGRDGLLVYRQLLQALKQLHVRQWTLIAEIDSSEENSFKQMVKKILPQATISFKQDLTGAIRAALVKNK